MKRPLSLFLIHAIAVAAAACGDVEPLPPEAQWLIYVDTDSPLPPAPGEASDATESTPLFDRLSVELYAPGEGAPCTGCTRDFSIDRRFARDRQASFGFAPRPSTSGYRARIRLYRSGGVAGPRAASSIEHVLDLPAVAPGTIVPLHTVMLVEELGTPHGTLESPEAPRSGRPLSSLVGSWAGALRSDCADAPGKGEVCVPGGAFWMGDLQGESLEALVHIDPFFVDATEVTVSALRASGLATADDPKTDRIRACRYTDAPGDWEDHPINCISKTMAAAYCKAEGKRLGTDAEHEYLNTGTRGDAYAWGMDPPGCKDAVYARVGGAKPDRPYFDLDVAAQACRSLGIGTDVVKSGARDRLELPSGTIFDLAGNVAEWVEDEGDADCNEPGVRMNPICRDAASSVLRIRGGSWADVGLSLRGSGRKAIARTIAESNELGFRCVRR